MGFFSKSRTLETTEDEPEKLEKKGGLMNALLGTGKYARTDEQKQEEQEARSLSSRLEKINIKKYKRQMAFRFNDDKNRIEVGDDFTMDKLPDIIYSLVGRNIVFKRAVGGLFGLKDQRELQRVIRTKRNTIRKIEQKLNSDNERKRVISLERLF